MSLSSNYLPLHLPSVSPAIKPAFPLTHQLNRCLDGPMLRVETYWPPEYPPTTPPVRMVFNIHQRLLRLHSSHYRQLLPAHDEPQTSSVELSLAVNLCVRPTVFQRVKDWCYTGKLGSFLDDRKRVGPAQTSSDAKHKPKRSGRPYKERQYSKQAQKRKRIRHQVSPFEEQYMLSEMREFAAKYGMPKLEQEVLRLLMVPVYRRPVKGCRQLCCVEFHL